MDDSARIVDVDDPGTWPERVREWVERWGRQRIADLHEGTDVSTAQEDGFRDLLEGTRLLAYHSTRLLEHEIEAIRRDGLAPLSAELVSGRIDRAWEQGYLPEPERDALHGAHIFASPSVDMLKLKGRTRGVYLLLGRSAFDWQRDHIHEWLNTWGGPALYEGVSPKRLSLLKELGRPTIVAAALEFRNERFRSPVNEPLGLVFSGIRHRDPLFSVTELCYSARIPPADLVGMWHPGDTEYDRHPELPRD